VTPDAIDALGRAGLSRRGFLWTSGALVVSFSASLCERAGAAQGPFDTRSSHVDPRRLDSWIAITADGRVTAYTGKCDLGQGMLTAQTQLVAEELSVPPDRVTLIQCDTAVTPDQGTTSGSRHHGRSDRRERGSLQTDHVRGARGGEEVQPRAR
jgi:hypothetical protein